MSVKARLEEQLQNLRAARAELDAEIAELGTVIRNYETLANGHAPKHTRSSRKRAKQMSTAQRQQQILGAMRQAKKPVTATDLGGKLNLNRSSSGKYLKDMEGLGMVVRAGVKKTNGRDMFLYSLPSDPFAAPVAAVPEPD